MPRESCTAPTAAMTWHLEELGTRVRERLVEGRRKSRGRAHGTLPNERPRQREIPDGEGCCPSDVELSLEIPIARVPVVITTSTWETDLAAEPAPLREQEAACHDGDTARGRALRPERRRDARPSGAEHRVEKRRGAGSGVHSSSS